MKDWSLSLLLSKLHEDIEQKLATARAALPHPGTMGDASEGVWLDLLRLYLPKRYQAEKAFVCDSEGAFSQQLDVVVFDRQYSPPVFHFNGSLIIPAESVYAVFEAKQAINLEQVKYARAKLASVRVLKRTSLPVPHVSGVAKPKPLHHILGGLLTFESDWTPAFGDPLIKALSEGDEADKLDLGCVAAKGIFGRNEDGTYTQTPENKPATGFLFELIARLQGIATVPMIDIRAFARWLEK